MLSSPRLLALACLPLLAFAQAPVITQRPAADILVNAGQPATLSVTATGSPAPAYQWSKLGEHVYDPVAGATSATFTIASAQAADAGFYQVTVSNSAGNASASTQLSVNHAPTVATQPLDNFVRRHQTADFMAIIDAYPPPTAYQWTKDGVNFPTNPPPTPLVSILRVPALTRDDVAFYALTATNNFGTVTSRSAQLRLLDEPNDLVLRDPRPQTVVAGGSVAFSVPVPTPESSVPAGALASFQWLKDGAALPGATAARLLLKNVQATDAGLYTVQVSRGSDHETSRPARLTVIPTGAVATYTVDTVAGVTGQAGFQNTLDGQPALFSSPAGLALCPTPTAGGSVLLLADWGNNLLRQISGPGSSATTTSTFAGAGIQSGSNDGNALASARFNLPADVAVDVATRDVFVADAENSTIRRVTHDGLVTTPAGQAGHRGYADGVGPAALFSEPFGLATVGDALFVSDRRCHTIRRIGPDQTVTTFAGLANQAGSLDGTGQNARFNKPSGLDADLDGNLYVADLFNDTLRRVTPAGAVSRFAGVTGSSGTQDGPDGTARFASPNDVAVDGNGFVYVADYLSHTIRLVAPNGSVVTIAGNPGESGSADGPGATARFNTPTDLALDGNGNLYVSDNGNQTVRRIAIGYRLAPAFTTQPGSDFVVPGATVVLSCAVAGLPTPALQWFFNGAAIPGATAPTFTIGNAQIANAGAYTVVATNSSGTATSAVATLGVGRYQVSTFAGNPNGNASSLGYNSVTGQPNGFANGPAASATFWYPSSVAVAPDGRVFVADSDTNTVRLVAGGQVSTFAGENGPAGSTDGPAASATFCGPVGLALDPAGNLFVAEYCNSIIREISSGTVSTFAGTGVSGNQASIQGSQNGQGPAAQFNRPWAVAVHGPTGRVFVADSNNQLIRAIDAQANVTTLAGQAGVPGYVDGPATVACFSFPSGVAVDAAQNVYVADNGNNVIRKITPAGVVSTFAGSGTAGSADGIGTAAQFSSPYGVAFGPGGHLYVADSGNHLIRRISPQGVVTTLAGQAGVTGNTDGAAAQASFNFPTGLAVDAAGNIYVADMYNNVIRLIRPAAP